MMRKWKYFLMMAYLCAGNGYVASSLAAQPPIDSSTVPCDKPGAGDHTASRGDGSGSPCSFGSGTQVPPDIPAEQAPDKSRSAPATPDPAVTEPKGVPGSSGTDSARPIR